MLLPLNDVEIAGEYSGGCAYSGFISTAGTPAICDVGPAGCNFHRPDEWMYLNVFLSERGLLQAQFYKLYNALQNLDFDYTCRLAAAIPSPDGSAPPSSLPSLILIA